VSTTNSPPASLPTTGGHGTEGVTSMQAERTALIQKVVKAVQALKPNEAIFLPGECIAARSESGTLRFASGWFGPIWRRGDGLTMAREHVEMLLSGNPYYASHNRRELSIPSTLRPCPVENVGRRGFYVVVRRGGSLATEGRRPRHERRDA
jgi:hypothetical protein